MKHIKEYYDTFYSRVKDYELSKKFAHRIATQKGYFMNLFKKLSPEDRALIEWYRDGGYGYISKYLYGEGIRTRDEHWRDSHKLDPSIKSLKDAIVKLDDILENTRIRKDVVLWKGLRFWSRDSKLSLINVIRNLKVGETYTFENFFSTSLNFQYALFAFGFEEKIMMKINCPSGAKGTYISHDVTENEVLLQRNQTIKLKRIYDYDIGKHFKGHSGTLVTIYEFDLIQ